MAPAATNGDAASLDDIKAPAGVVLPPKEIRNILEKTAGYVARNGVSFEDRIREKESQNPKFSFLSATDAYNPYYQWRLSEIRAGRGTAVSAGRVAEPAAAEQKIEGPPKPPDYQFSARMPRMNQKDLDVVRLTALFVAKNGRQFTTQLGQREAGNPQFRFLIPNHTFHNYFQHLVDQYSMLIRAGGLDGEGGRLQEELTGQLKANLDNKYNVLHRARRRMEYAIEQEFEKQKKDIEEEQKKLEFARIDWSDFVVVETIVFSDADDQINLPPPTTLSDLQYASLEERKQVSIGADMRIEEAMPTDMENPYPPQRFPLVVYPPHANQERGQGAADMPPPQQVYQSQDAAGSRHRPAEEEDEEERRIRERAEARARVEQAHAEAQGGIGPMKIRENYVPRAAQKAANRQGQMMTTCPNCKQQLPMNELSEHMRIELLDPRWREQKAKAESRYATSNVTMADVATNLKRLASQRSDVFDMMTGQEVLEEDAARRKKQHMAAQTFDGNPDSVSQAHLNQAQKFNVEEQIARIHQKFASDKK